MVNAEGSAAGLRIEVATSPGAGRVERIQCVLPAGSTVGDALRHLKLVAQGQRLGVWGKLCNEQRLLRDGDRVELYRPLRVDPMDARRERQRTQAGRRPPPKDQGKRSTDSRR